VLAYFDEDITAIGLMDRSQELLSPRGRAAGRLTGIGVAHFFSRRFDEAAATLLVSLGELQAHATPHRSLASCYAHMGRLDEAREIISRLRTITPAVIPSYSP
jgi:adenylate cyclase